MEKPTTQKTDWEKDRVRGKVKETIMVDYDVKSKFGEDIKTITGKTAFRYDDKGNKTERIKDGSSVYKIISKYDGKGNKIEVAHYKTDGTLTSRTIYKYDDKGNKIEDVCYCGEEDEDLFNKTIYKYDAMGNEVECSSYDEKGQLEYKFISKYDDMGNKIEYASYTARGTLLKITKSTYTYY